VAKKVGNEAERAHLGAVLSRALARRRPGQPLARKDAERVAWAVREAVYDDIGTFLAQAHYSNLRQQAALREALRHPDLAGSEQEARRKLLGILSWQQSEYENLAAYWGRPIVIREGVHPAAADYHEIATTEPAALGLDQPCPACGQREVGIMMALTGPLVTDLAFWWGCGLCGWRDPGREVTPQEVQAAVIGFSRGETTMVRRVLDQRG
jgi:hypothetical protein